MSQCLHHLLSHNKIRFSDILSVIPYYNTIVAGLQSMQVDTLKDIDDKGDKDMKSPTAIPNDYAMFPLGR